MVILSDRVHIWVWLFLYDWSCSVVSAQFGCLELAESCIGSVPTTPDPNTSAKVSRYKWEAYRDTNWWCIYYFLPQGGHTFAKVCHRNGRCIAIFFHMYWGQGSV